MAEQTSPCAFCDKPAPVRQVRMVVLTVCNDHWQSPENALDESRARERALAESNRLLALYLKMAHGVKHGLSWEECDAPGCEEARSAIGSSAGRGSEGANA